MATKVTKKKTTKKAAPKKKPAAKKAPKRVLVAKVAHYFGNIKVAAFQVKAPIKVGDTLVFEGGETLFSQKIASLQKEHESVTRAKKGDDVGMKVRKKVHEGYRIYKEG